MNFLLGIILITSLKIFPMEPDDSAWVCIDEELQSPSEQEFKAAYQRFTSENPGHQPNQKFLKLLQDSRTKTISPQLHDTIPTLLKGFRESYTTWQERQVIALYFLNRKKEEKNEYYLSEEERRHIAAIIMRHLKNPSVHISQKTLEVMLLLDTEALLKEKDEYVFKVNGFEISLNCTPKLVTRADFDTVAGHVMAYIFREPLTDSERYARYMHCGMWQYTGIHFEE
ncbi:MAG: hypothetical protein KBD04_03085 [Proteobacteria bacterium]|nr:hypothetical protein [Pseudomonadota bacterium]